MSGIYIHIPFCKQACHYCDFHFSTNTNSTVEMIEMICRELELRKNYLGSDNPVESIYFGGGTPSLIPSPQIEKILDQIHKHFTLNIKEVTLEANPDDLNHVKLQELKALGVDRLSIGIQTFDAGILQFYNRAHSAQESLNAIALAKAAGFQKLSIDLIYGFPSENHDIWIKDLEIALAQDPGHISSYCLTVEPKTALGNWEKKGIYTPSTDDFAAEQFEMLMESMGKAGYVQYEISNFGRPGQFAIHNTNYWLGVPYLGVGPSAHSFDGKIRGANISNNALYIKNLQRNELTFSEEASSTIDTANDYILTSLRTIWGLDLGYLRGNLGFDLLRLKRKETELLFNENLLLKENNRLLLTARGKLLADSIAASLFLE
ncbi:oxygen-independent coproporphyrinogen-3 oxidase [Aquiflexum balticum DSM 16537]|uniref:Heme chaperone HemW n=1 Tax=Aquiflexum balticum DSM 16537 TaxID=758820 RepID=A0A1W2H050_9BACT|nr:radical SAM family heme chaperone HemW [Aquiflexum balticum]SMD42315.1 oxygen-independent coproporphyrinogen-3 oxidase [Aquiflexum balticum DSM 16537]